MCSLPAVHLSVKGYTCTSQMNETVLKSFTPGSFNKIFKSK